MTPQNDNRRRHYWINPRFQGRYIFTILALQMITALATALVSFALAMVLLSPDFQAGPQWTGIFVVFVLMILMVSLLLVWLGVRVSHKICGPVYRMEKTLEAIRNGQDPGQIHLRDGDQLQELADALNQTLTLLRRSDDVPTPLPEDVRRELEENRARREHDELI